MKSIIYTIIFLTIFSIPKISACSCVDVPKTFSKNIQANHIIFRGTVIGQIEIQNDSNNLLLYHGLTKIHVNEWYQNKMKSDTIYYANGQGSMCTTSLEYLKTGDEVVIKAVKENMYHPTIEFYLKPDKKLIRFMKKYRDKATVGYHICDVSVLKIQNQMVVGNITKNYQRLKWNRINFIRRISEKWADKLEAKLRESKPKYQSWELNKFAKLMKKKCNSL